MSKKVFEDGDEGVRLIVSDNSHAQPAAGARRPVHVIYGGANLYRHDSAQKLGRIALETLVTYAPNFADLARGMGLPGADALPSDAGAVDAMRNSFLSSPEELKAENFSAWLANAVYDRTVEKLRRQPVEDLRIDFEDGFGVRSDEEEDAAALASSAELALACESGTVTEFCGIRIKPLSSGSSARAVKTLEMFVKDLAGRLGGRLPDNFVVTLPKVSGKDEIKQLVKELERIEDEAGLARSSVGIEFLIETPQAILNYKGKVPIASMVRAADGRCRSVHFGAYDYTASLGISSEHQHIHHPACEFARQIMLVSLAPLGIPVSDSVTNLLPVAPHRGPDLAGAEMAANCTAILSGWREHFANVSRSMANGFYQSWDLHPNQLPARFAAVHTFYLSGADTAFRRIRSFADKAAQAILTGQTFDDAASARGIVNFLERGAACGAFSDEEIERFAGSSLLQLRQLFADVTSDA